MQNFQQILTQAAQLKQHQLKKDRKGYQSLPQFLKSGLGYNKKYEIIRKQHFHYQYRISNKVKEQGNSLFKQNKIQDALSKYQQALAIFRYITSKSYENLKDQDLEYCNYNSGQLNNILKQKFDAHLCAIYLNICNCLTKLNKKQDAIFSADQALKIKNTAKAHYRKAQSYLKFVNRDANDIKLGILQLKQAYSLQKSADILNQMYAAKQNYEKQSEKSKNWFKFMFDKNKKQSQQNKQPQQIKQKQSENENQKVKQKQKQIIKQQTKEQIQRKKHLSELQKATETASISDEKAKFQQTKQKLQIYIKQAQNQWQKRYQKDFIKRNGSKIYSILKIYKYEDLASQFRAILAKCLQNSKDEQKQRKSYQDFFAWLKARQMNKIDKYVQRYELQTNWIRQNRNKNQSIKNRKEEQMEIIQQKQFNMKKQQIQKQEQQKQQVSQQIRDIIQQNKIQPNKTNNNFNRQMQNNQPEQKIDKKKFIAVGIILFLLIIRFLWK